MLKNAIPGLVRGFDPTIPRQVLESKLKVIHKRRALIEAALSAGAGDDYQSQELKAEDRALADMRAEVEQALHPKPKPRRSPELQRLYAEQRMTDVAFLRATIKQQTEQRVLPKN